MKAKMTDTDPLLSPKTKLMRAKDLIADATVRIKTFLSNRNLIETFLEADPDGVRQIIKARVLKSPPSDIAPVVADAIANLRSALDHLVSCLAVKNGGNLKDASFPFAGDWKQFGAQREQKKISSLSPEARQMICDLQPYRIKEMELDKGGNNVLWALNRLRNTDLHDAIVPVGVVSVGHEASVATKSHLGLNVAQAPRRFIFDQDLTAEVMRVPGRPEDIKGQLKVGLELGFGEIDPVAGYPVLMVLNDFFSLVSKIVGDAEKRFFL